MTKFPFQITELASELIKLNFVDFPFLSMVGRDHFLLREDATSVLNTLISIRIRTGAFVPKPTETLNSICIAEHIDFRLKLFWDMQDRGLNIDAFAAELGLSSEITTNILGGEGDVEFPPYLEAIASRDVHCNKKRGLSTQTDRYQCSQSAELVMLAGGTAFW